MNLWVILTFIAEEDRKAIFGILGKLHILAGSSKERLLSVDAIALKAIKERVPNDATSKAALNRFQAALSKTLEDAKFKPRYDFEDETARTLHMDTEDGEAPVAKQGKEFGGEDSVLNDLLDDDEDNM